MGVAVNLSLLSAYLLIVSVHYGSVYGVRCERRRGPLVVTYTCPEDTSCCDTGDHACCPNFVTTGEAITVTFFTMFLVVAAFVVCCCVFVRQMMQRRRGAVRTHEIVTVVSGGPRQNSPQGQTDCCPPPQPPYNPRASFNPYPGVPPPAYQPSAPAYTVNLQVTPPAPIPTPTKE